jgi:hypothetical protein
MMALNQITSLLVINGDAVIPILLKQTHEFQKTLKRSQDKLNMLTGVLVVSKKNKKKRRNYFAF